jgi:anti-sigma factor RsiW
LEFGSWELLEVWVLVIGVLPGAFVFLEWIREMSCRGIQKLLGRFMDGELGARDRARVEQHLETCADCRVGLDELRSLQNLLKATAPAAPPEEYWTAFSQRFWKAWLGRRYSAMVNRSSFIVHRSLL